MFSFRLNSIFNFSIKVTNLSKKCRQMSDVIERRGKGGGIIAFRIIFFREHKTEMKKRKITSSLLSGNPSLSGSLESIFSSTCWYARIANFNLSQKEHRFREAFSRQTCKQNSLVTMSAWITVCFLPYREVLQLRTWERLFRRLLFASSKWFLSARFQLLAANLQLWNISRSTLNKERFWI